MLARSLALLGRWDGCTGTPTSLLPVDSPFTLAISRMRLAIAVLSDLKLALPTPIRLSTPDFDRSVHIGTSVLTEAYRSAAHYLPVPIMLKSAHQGVGFVDASASSSSVYVFPSPRHRGQCVLLLLSRCNR